MKQTYYVFETEMGWVGIAGSDGRVSRLSLPRETAAEAVVSITGGTSEQFVETSDDFSGAAGLIADYFAGNRVTLECDLDLSGGTEFQRAAWDKCREIPFGETRTYGWIADEVGCPSGMRAVGRAMGANPVPIIIPCHRVVRSDGGLGGFSSGLRWKVRLLEMEQNGRGNG